jgi:cytosolic carboxypeptidase protein 2/3
VEGLVQQLVKSRLTEYFCFKIVPMVNVDGVVFGNYRSNLAGLDLNRHWFKPDESCKEI